MTKSLKEIADILKFGQDGLGDDPFRKPKPKLKPYAPNVKNMQDKIRIFSKNVTTYSKSGQQQAQDGKQAFNDFITQSFMATQKVKGVEFSDDATETALPEKQKRQSDLFEMHVVVDNLARTGGASSELKSDGTWGIRTENALRNVYAFAKALLDLDQKFTGSKPKEFSEGNLMYLKEASKLKDDQFEKASNGEYLIKDDIFKGKKVSTIADNIAATLDQLNNYYNKFLTRTLNDPRHSIFIQNDKPLDKITSKKESLSISEDESLKKELQSPTHKIKVTIDPTAKSPNVGKSFEITLANLQNKASFDELCKNLQIDPSRRKLFLKSLVSQINNEIALGTQT